MISEITKPVAPAHPPCRRKHRPLFWGGVGVAAAVGLGLAARHWLTPPPSPGSSSTGQVPSPAVAAAERDEPLRVRPLVARVLPLPAAECAWVRQQIQPLPKAKLSASAMFHLLRVHGLKGQLRHEDLPSCEALLKLLTVQQLSTGYFGYPTLLRTRSGIRYAPDQTRLNNPGAEYHRDQALAAFAELGVPLSLPLSVDGESFTVRDMLRDSVANFHLNQQELAWTAMAYALYLPPQKEWRNRFGETYTFDQLATKVLDLPLDKESCGGSHVFYALTLLLRVDAELPILSDQVRSRVKDLLLRATTLAVRTQRPDGAWMPGWYQELYPRPLMMRFDTAVSEQLVNTGHLTEWFLYLPRELQVPEEVLARAAGWLYRQLQAAGAEEQAKLMCPYAHAACALRQLMFASEVAEKTDR